MSYDLAKFMDGVKARAPGQYEYHQAVADVLCDVLPAIENEPEFEDLAILERLVEPDRMISFRVTWEADDGSVHVNRGYRIQFNGAIGPYKGGIRFHQSVSPSILKFLAFEQTFKNALTGLPMGGGKGGADFDPKGRSEREIMRFCAAFMSELFHHIGPDRDVPAGDINVGEREIGYLFGAHRRLTNQYESALTGKGLSYGGSEFRVEATGYGLVYFTCLMLDRIGDSFSDKRVVISGAGNVATHAAEKTAQLGGKVITLSDSRGFVHHEAGIDEEKIARVRELKREGRSLSEFADEIGADWHPDKAPWAVPCDVALPCATQNELGIDDAKALAANGCRLIAEGANMPLTGEATRYVRSSQILLGPAKAANAGGVAVSGLEITQNRLRRRSPRDEVRSELQEIMKRIHDRCVEFGGEKSGKLDYVRGANIAAFRRVSGAMIAQGLF